MDKPPRLKNHNLALAMERAKAVAQQQSNPEVSGLEELFTKLKETNQEEKPASDSPNPLSGSDKE